MIEEETKPKGFFFLFKKSTRTKTFDTSRFLLYNIGIEHTDKRSLPKGVLKNNCPIGKQGGYFLLLWESTIETIKVPTVAIAMIN